MMMKSRFPLGTLVATHGFMAKVGDASTDEILKAVARHSTGDWGDLSDHDAEVNESALQEPEQRIMSVFHTDDGVRFYVITEWDRSVTTVLLPEDY
jgi:rRNA maturation endonuclease Nob1